MLATRLPLILACCAFLALPGCRQTAAVRAPKSVRLHIPEPQVVEGSLWQSQRRGAGLVADSTARNVGDLVTILVVESTDAKRNRKMDTSRSQNYEAGVDKFVYKDLLRYKGELPSIAMKSARTHAGEGSLEDTGSVKTTISAQVTEVLPNGSLMLLGQKELVVSDETQTVALTGIARPQDILPNNTILSTKIAEARISITGNGPLNDAQRRTLVGRVFDWVNLF